MVLNHHLKPYALALATLLCLLTACPSRSTVTISERSYQQGLPDFVVHRQTYRSQSQQYSMLIDPSQPNGAHEATYTFSDGEQQLWSKTFPFTLYQAETLDDGTTVGYAYTQGYEGCFNRPGETRPGHIVIAMIDKQGNLIRQEKLQRSESGYLHGHPHPKISTMCVNHSSGTVLLSIARERSGGGDEETWQVYEATSGKLISQPDQTPYLPTQAFVIGMQAIEGTPLWLVQSWCYPERQVGTNFSLLDNLGKQHWTLDLPADFELSEEEASERLQDQVREHGTIYPSPASGQFEVQFIRAAQRVSFEVSPSDDLAKPWNVREKSRVAAEYEPTLFRAAELGFAPVPQIELESLASITLQGAPGYGEIAVRDIVGQFAIGPGDELAFVRRSSSQSDLMVVDSTGQELARVELPTTPDKDFSWQGVVSAGPAEFLVYGEEQHRHGKIWRINYQTKQIAAITNPDGHSITSLSALADGRLVMLGKERSRYTSTEWLSLLQVDGTRIWAFPKNSNNMDKGLFSSESMVASEQLGIAVLDNIQERIKFFSLQGDFVRAIDLKSSWGAEPSYVTDLSLSPQGTLLVTDFNGPHDLNHMQSDGKLLKRFNVHPNSSAGRVYAPRFDSQDNIWISNGDNLMRVSGDGKVSNILGWPANYEKLGDIAALHADRTGRFYAIDRRTCGVHQFDAEGKFQRVYFDPARPARTSILPTLEVTDAGQVLLMLSDFPSAEVMSFNQNGETSKTARFNFNKLGFQHGVNKLLAIESMGIQRLTANGKIDGTLERDPEGKWFERIDHICSAPDGSLVVAVVRRGTRGTSEAWSALHVYDRDLKGLRSIKVPTDDVRTLDYDGRWIVFATESEVFLYRATGEPVGRFNHGQDMTHVYTNPKLTADNQLLMAHPSEIKRWRLPK